MEETAARIQALPCWHGPVSPTPLVGGITNENYLVEDAGEKFVVRLGGDIPVHQIMRFNELAASRAAHAAGISPGVTYAEPGILVLRFIAGQIFDAAAVRQNLSPVVELLRRAHREIPKHLRGPAMVFWVFHVIRDYAHTLREFGGPYESKLPEFLKAAAIMEKAVGAIGLAFCHNDLLPANLIDDGQRLWLIDWDYGGFNSPLFDLANLASNNHLAQDQERWLLQAYFERPPSDALWRSYAAMKCASLLRETMWSMVSELHSKLDFDYATYTRENLGRFESAYDNFQAELD